MLAAAVALSVVLVVDGGSSTLGAITPKVNWLVLCRKKPIMAQLSSQADLIAKIERLYAERDRLLQEDLAPEGAWVHQYSIWRTYPSGITHEYRYAKWQSQEPIFKRSPPKPGRKQRLVKSGKNPESTQHQYIGRVWSSSGLETEPEVIEAYEAEANRKKLEEITQAITEIEQILGRVLGGWE